MKLNYKRTLLIGLCFMSISAFWTFYDQVIPYMLEYSFVDTLHGIFGEKLFEGTFLCPAGGSSETFITNVVMTFDNIIAVLLLPLFGTLSDKTRTRLGKRTPYVLFGTIASVLLFVGLGIAEYAKNFWLFFALLLLLLIALATYRSPAVALMPDLTPRAYRSRGNAIINLMGTVGGGFSLLMVLLFVKTEKDAEGRAMPTGETVYLPTMIAIAAFMLITVLVFCLTIREKKLSDRLHATGELTDDDDREEEDGGVKGGKLAPGVRRSLIFMLLVVAFGYMAYNGCTTALSRYCLEVLGADLSQSSSFVLVALIVATASFLPIALLSAKIGRKKVVLGGAAMMALAFFGASFLREVNALIYIAFTLVGVGWAAINVNSYPMVVEMGKGADIGKYTGLYYLFSMSAQVATPILSGILLMNKSIGGYATLFPYAAICSLLAFVMMLFVRHGDAKPEKTGSLLETFGAGDD